jgi:K+ transporter
MTVHVFLTSDGNIFKPFKTHNLQRNHKVFTQSFHITIRTWKYMYSHNVRKYYHQKLEIHVQPLETRYHQIVQILDFYLNLKLDFTDSFEVL